MPEEYGNIGKLFGESDVVKDIDVKIKTKDNKFVDCSFSASLILDVNGKPVEIEGVIRDISQRIKTLKKLVESEEKLKEANLTKDKVFSIISHDLRGPISTNKSIVDLIVNEFEKISKEDIFKLLDSYKPTADATFFLLENLLSWSRSQMEQMSFNPGLNPINTIVSENVGLYSSQAQSKDIQLTNAVQSDLIGFFDKTILDIVVRNLISNALKFTPQNGHVEIKSSISDNFIYLSVTDSGVGIPKSQLKGLFKDLDTNKITSVGTNNEKGAGLGLVLCKEFVELNGGEISVESKVGEGSSFIFSVPLYNY
jgi:signal transduction histidine kinase